MALIASGLMNTYIGWRISHRKAVAVQMSVGVQHKKQTLCVQVVLSQCIHKHAA